MIYFIIWNLSSLESTIKFHRNSSAIDKATSCETVYFCGSPSWCVLIGESLEWINPSAMPRGVAMEVSRVPLERRHNVLRAKLGLIRKCLTLVKPDLDRPDVLFRYRHLCGSSLMCAHSRKYIVIHAGYTTCHPVCYMCNKEHIYMLRS